MSFANTNRAWEGAAFQLKCDCFSCRSMPNEMCKFGRAPKFTCLIPHRSTESYDRIRSNNYYLNNLWSGKLNGLWRWESAVFLLPSAGCFSNWFNFYHTSLYIIILICNYIKRQQIYKYCQAEMKVKLLEIHSYSLLIQEKVLVRFSLYMLILLQKCNYCLFWTFLHLWWAGQVVCGFFSCECRNSLFVFSFLVKEKNQDELFCTVLHWEGSQFHLFQILMWVCGKPLNTLVFSLIQ